MNDETYKVSVITVVYNGVKTIEQTIQSVLRQTYRNIEYIIIDGASTDGTQQVIEKYKDKIAYYASEKDEGLYYAMNKGIEKATGDIVGIVNSDDWYAGNAVEEAIKYFEENDAELVFGDIICVSETKEEKIWKACNIKSMWYQMSVPHPSVFVKKCVYDRLGKFDTEYRIASDYELVLRFFSEGVKFGRIDDVMAYFRCGGLSATNRKIVYDEGYQISMKYIDRCPYKEKVLHKIREVYGWACFDNMISDEKNTLCQLVRGYFQTYINSIVIFGTGIWGEKCWMSLMDSGVEILHFADNDESKWNTEFHGIKVIKPDELKTMEAYVLIAVMESGEAIKKQMADMRNSGLRYVTIKELMTLYCERSQLLTGGIVGQNEEKYPVYI